MSLRTAVIDDRPAAPFDDRTTKLLSYSLAFLIGIAAALYLVPLHLIFATDSLLHPVLGDYALNITGQRYYILDAWRWPLLVAKPLVAPEGTNVAFMDSIPLLMIPMKPLRHWLPPGFHTIFLWMALCWVAQPISAVFALRSAGERRLLPNLAIAIFAVSTPTLIFRFGHSALCSHFLILIALGLYFRIVRDPKAKLLVSAGVLVLISLLVNPYIMYMVVAVLCAAPLTLLLRRQPGWIRAAIGIGGGVVVVAGIALLLDYGGAVPIAGFGIYSMNLLSPVYPYGSSFLHGFATPMDATSGQYEGYQYLGLGIILLVLLLDFLLGPEEKLILLWRHAGLILVCLALTALALSTKIYLGHHLVLDLRTPRFLLQFRSSGRFFWPVGYAILLGGIVVLCRSLSGRTAAVVLLILAMLQFAETRTLRHSVRAALRVQNNWTLDTAVLRPLLAQSSKLTILPTFMCGADFRSPAWDQLFLLASEKAIPVNTSLVGRFKEQPKCSLPKEIPVAPGEMLVLLPEHSTATLLAVDGWRDLCRQIGPLVVCSHALEGRSDLPLPQIATLPLATELSTAAGGAGTQALGSGWSVTEPWGVWSEGSNAELVGNIADPAGKPVMLTVSAHSLGFHPETSQQISVTSDGRQLAVWNVKEGGDAEYTALVPAPAANQPIQIDFHIAHPVTPRHDGLGPDDRELGLGLTKFRLDLQPQ